MRNLKEIKKLGLNEKETRVYLAILELGRATTINIARKTIIKRTTVYDIVLSLIQQGFVSEARRGKRRVFIAEDPELLVQKFEQKLSDIKSTVPFLASMYSESVPIPKLKFYDGINGIRNIMEEMLIMKEKEQLYWGSISDLIDVFGNYYMESWVKRRVRKGIWSRCFLTQKYDVPKLYKRSDSEILREIKWMPGNFNFDGALCVFDNKVCYISSRKESFGFVIESNEFSKLIKLIFKSMWTIVN